MRLKAMEEEPRKAKTKWVTCALVWYSFAVCKTSQREVLNDWCGFCLKSECEWEWLNNGCWKVILLICYSDQRNVWRTLWVWLAKKPLISASFVSFSESNQSQLGSLEQNIGLCMGKFIYILYVNEELCPNFGLQKFEWIWGGAVQMCSKHIVL